MYVNTVWRRRGTWISGAQTESYEDLSGHLGHTDSLWAGHSNGCWEKEQVITLSSPLSQHAHIVCVYVCVWQNASALCMSTSRQEKRGLRGHSEANEQSSIQRERERKRAVRELRIKSQADWCRSLTCLLMLKYHQTKLYSDTFNISHKITCLFTIV